MEGFKTIAIEGVALAGLCGLFLTGIAVGWPLWGLVLLALLATAVAFAFVSRIRKRVRGRRRGWRLRRGSGVMLYEELMDGDWQAIEIDFKTLRSTVTFDLIHFRGPATWAAYPEWARARRDEIIGRVSSEWRGAFEPGYEPRR